MAVHNTARLIALISASVLAGCSSGSGGGGNTDTGGNSGGGGGGGTTTTPPTIDTSPLATVDAYQVQEGALLNATSVNGVLANDRSRNGGAISAAVETPPQYGTLTLSSNGTFTYQHDGSETPSDSFVYRVTGSDGQSNLATANISIQTENDRPLANTRCYQESGIAFNGQLPASDEETPLSALTFFFDPQDNTVTTTQSSRLGNTITLGAQGAFSYQQSNTESSGWDEFTYYVSDGTHTSANSIRVILPSIRIMPLGDSITRGVNNFTAGSPSGTQTPTPDQSLGYRADLQDQLRQDGINFDFVGSQAYGNNSGLPLYDPDTEGHPGATPENLLNGCASCIPPTPVVGETPYGLDNITLALNNNPPDVILLHAGTNLVSASATQTVSALQNLVTAINSWNQQPANRTVEVVLARLIPSDITAFTTDPQPINTLNNAVNGMGNQYDNVTVVDMHSALLPPPSADFDDDLHPTATGYGKMASRWYQSLQTADTGVLQRHYRCN